MAIMGVYEYLRVSGCLWATLSLYMSGYGYMMVYRCLWLFMSVFGCQ